MSLRLILLQRCSLLLISMLHLHHRQLPCRFSQLSTMSPVLLPILCQLHQLNLIHQFLTSNQSSTTTLIPLLLLISNFSLNIDSIKLLQPQMNLDLLSSPTNTQPATTALRPSSNGSGIKASTGPRCAPTAAKRSHHATSVSPTT